MRIVKFLLIDAAFMATICISFLFLRSSDLRINILLVVALSVSAFIFEIFYLGFYILSEVTGFYRRSLHVILFSTFFIYVNYVTIETAREGVFDFQSYGIIALVSIILLVLYFRILNHFDKEISSL
jgi:hypothetical protein